MPSWVNQRADLENFGWRQRIGFPLGLALFGALLFLPAPGGLSAEGKRAAAVAILMAVWWITEALPIAATALVPLAFYPFLSIMTMADTARRYADPVIFLFMGGFMIALAMQKWNLHKRLALYVINWIGGGLYRMLLGFMLAAGFISMWVSNTATAVMMLPIGMAVIGQLNKDQEEGQKKVFAAALMLGIAYACSIGGTATLIGTPPNMIFAGQSKALFPDLPEVGFVQWIQFALPLALGFLALTWVYLSLFVIGRSRKTKTDRGIIQREIKALGSWTRGERAVMAIFLLTAFCWIMKSDIAIGSWVIPGWTTVLNLPDVHDGTIAILAALVLFVFPLDLKKGVFLLDWESAVKLPWGVLILFGGGFALAESFQTSGLASWLGEGLGVFRGVPVWVLVGLLCFSTTFLTELMSNTALVTTLLPVVAAASQTLGIHPYFLMVPVTVSASFAFMMPVATPPNAIVFGSGCLTIPRMAKAGLVLNLAGVVWITLLTFLLLRPVFGLAVRAS
jgi:sodium-dependent dicarboxylate transporter 2/3/5